MCKLLMLNSRPRVLWTILEEERLVYDLMDVGSRIPFWVCVYFGMRHGKMTCGGPVYVASCSGEQHLMCGTMSQMILVGWLCVFVMRLDGFVQASGYRNHLGS